MSPRSLRRWTNVELVKSGNDGAWAPPSAVNAAAGAALPPMVLLRRAGKRCGPVVVETVDWNQSANPVLRVRGRTFDAIGSCAQVKRAGPINRFRYDGKTRANAVLSFAGLLVPIWGVVGALTDSPTWVKIVAAGLTLAVAALGLVLKSRAG